MCLIKALIINIILKVRMNCNLAPSSASLFLSELESFIAKKTKVYINTIRPQ